MFLIYRTYYGMIRYSGFDDIRKIFNSCTTAIATLIIAKVIVTQINPKLVNHIFPGYRILLYHYLITLVIMVLSRFFIRRIYNEMYKNTRVKKSPTVIYGAGEGGVMLFRAIQQDKESMYKVIAFADDNPKKSNKNINTIPIYPPDKIFNNNFIETNHIEVLILALPSILGERKKD
jgi:Predicted nucleoside-diphosphate sugar epimerases